MKQQTPENISMWDALRIAKRHGFKSNHILSDWDMMQIVTAAFEEGQRQALETIQNNGFTCENGV